MEVKIAQIGSFFPYLCGCRFSFLYLQHCQSTCKRIFSLDMCSFNFAVIVHISSKKSLKQVMHITAQYLSKADCSFFLLSLPITYKVTKDFVDNEQYLAKRQVSTSFVPERALPVLFVYRVPQMCACGTSSSTFQHPSGGGSFLPPEVCHLCVGWVESLVILGLSWIENSLYSTC